MVINNAYYINFPSHFDLFGLPYSMGIIEIPEPMRQPLSTGSIHKERNRHVQEALLVCVLPPDDSGLPGRPREARRRLPVELVQRPPQNRLFPGMRGGSAVRRHDLHRRLHLPSLTGGAASCPAGSAPRLGERSQPFPHGSWPRAPARSPDSELFGELGGDMADDIAAYEKLGAFYLGRPRRRPCQLHPGPAAVRFLGRHAGQRLPSLERRGSILRFLLPEETGVPALEDGIVRSGLGSFLETGERCHRLACLRAGGTRRSGDRREDPPAPQGGRADARQHASHP